MKTNGTNILHEHHKLYLHSAMLHATKNVKTTLTQTNVMPQLSDANQVHVYLLSSCDGKQL